MRQQPVPVSGSSDHFLCVTDAHYHAVRSQSASPLLMVKLLDTVQTVIQGSPTVVSHRLPAVAAHAVQCESHIGNTLPEDSHLFMQSASTWTPLCEARR